MCCSHRRSKGKYVYLFKLLKWNLFKYVRQCGIVGIYRLWHSHERNSQPADCVRYLTSRIAPPYSPPPVTLSWSCSCANRSENWHLHKTYFPQAFGFQLLLDVVLSCLKSSYLVPAMSTPTMTTSVCRSWGDRNVATSFGIDFWVRRVAKMTSPIAIRPPVHIYGN